MSSFTLSHDNVRAADFSTIDESTLHSDDFGLDSRSDAVVRGGHLRHSGRCATNPRLRRTEQLAVVRAVQHELEAIAHLGFLEQTREVNLDSAFGKIHCARDFFVLQSLSEQLENLLFTLAEIDALLARRVEAWISDFDQHFAGGDPLE